MQLHQTQIPGCFEIELKVLKDTRGSFVKTFHLDTYNTDQLVTNFAEEYYSVSSKNVLRGLHFQLPPQDHTKIVYCVQGAVFDVILDLRVGSPTYGKFQSFELSAAKANLLYIPPGLAHGFYVTSEQAIMMYKVTTVYAPACDAGIHWRSAGIPWPCEDPIVSSRDNEFQALSDFNSPFVY